MRAYQIYAVAFTAALNPFALTLPPRSPYCTLYHLACFLALFKAGTGCATREERLRATSIAPAARRVVLLL